MNNLNNKGRLYFTKIISASAIGYLFILPIYMMVVSSLKPNADVFDLALLPKIVSFDGYRRVLDENFLRYFGNSFFIATTVTLVALVFHAMAGYSLARLNFGGKNLVFIWILSTLMVPFSVIMIPLFILVKNLNWLNTFQGVIVPAIPHAYGIFLFRQFFLTIPKELEEAAKIDGCSLWKIFSRIFLPLIKPVAITLAVAFFIANWNNYLWPLIVNQQQHMWVLQVAIACFIGRNDTPWDAVMASGVITIIPTVIIFFILQKYLVEGIKMSGVK
ncbi:carbohydrate ABC transporter membrane protein 2 (CUT1 family) [Hydrogenispora ethanolica]|uniref:Carbohydrate ABC transporter membrane protein 2 (CUT1 family) n=1 Tax=Hydrogenispora ethanolica TaxID=1082276 RepID=A0A4R1QJS3_HYDET|nr:carbohydrate ABC transporter permease [Hydrogenispora ethanolica]TCL53806.1 carbohydrate ABC transporter membrane protein 2 (CUT1 family) [Hydrogenispora ethanolica]